jgi:ubiquinone/menaquinone biosynthesis C-methylase UbiE
MDKLEQVICGEQGPIILQTLFRLSRGDPLDDGGRAVLPTLAELGVGRRNASGFELNEFGYKCADAAREYIFWVERGRRLHFEDSCPELALHIFENKRVLEIGPGWGCSLFRLQQVSPHVRGREIEEVYVRFASIFAKLEGVQPPTIDVGGGEELPYAENSFDWVLMWSAMQYMDVQTVVREVARVLAPGGRFVATQPLFPLLLGEFPRALRHPRELAHQSAALINSLSYGWFRRRLFKNVAGKSTIRPVFLTRRQIISIVNDAGLRFLPDLSWERGGDIVLVAEKRVDVGTGSGGK